VSQPPLPGDPPRAADRAAMLRVDQAGEYGATRIYQGQLAVLGRSRNVGAIRAMAETEARHLAAFDDLLYRHRVRPTLLQPLWSVAGYALGAATALIGEKAAMACTVAVEEVIDEHYRGQIERLGDVDADLARTLVEFRDDELAHRDIALAEGARDTPGYDALCGLIKTGSRLAIWLSTRF
jgi:3-demethoxyubiquinol 3-hydroxylase